MSRMDYKTLHSCFFSSIALKDATQIMCLKMCGSFWVKTQGRWFRWLASGVAECCVWWAVHLTGLLFKTDMFIFVLGLLSMCVWKDASCLFQPALSLRIYNFVTVKASWFRLWVCLVWFWFCLVVCFFFLACFHLGPLSKNNNFFAWFYFDVILFYFKISWAGRFNDTWST